MSGPRLTSQYSDIVVVGAGPAGLAASVCAAASGAQVTLIDDNAEPGGQIWRSSPGLARDRQALHWVQRFQVAKVPVLSSAQVVSIDSHARTLLVETPEQVVELGYNKLILSTGARELFLPFPGWTLPGVMGVGGLQAMAKSGLPIRGKRIVLAGSGPLLLAVAAHLRVAGAHVPLLAEQANRRSLTTFGLRLCRFPAKLAQAAKLRSSLRGVAYRPNCWVTAAHGHHRLEAVHVQQGGRSWAEPCDYAGIAFGLQPNSELASLAGCKLTEGRAVVVDRLQRSSQPHVFCAGECTGIGGVDLALLEGSVAGYAAADRPEHTAPLTAPLRRAQAFARALHRAFRLRPELKQLSSAETFVCRCEDVSLARLRSFPSSRAAKLHTRFGMGPCQGRICCPAAEFLLGWQPDSIRPPVLAARLGTLAAAKLEQQDC